MRNLDKRFRLVRTTNEIFSRADKRVFLCPPAAPATLQYQSFAEGKLGMRRRKTAMTSVTKVAGKNFCRSFFGPSFFAPSSLPVFSSSFVLFFLPAALAPALKAFAATIYLLPLSRERREGMECLREEEEESVFGRRVGREGVNICQLIPRQQHRKRFRARLLSGLAGRERERSPSVGTRAGRKKGGRNGSKDREEEGSRGGRKGKAPRFQSARWRARL